MVVYVCYASSCAPCSSGPVFARHKSWPKIFVGTALLCRVDTCTRRDNASSAGQDARVVSEEGRPEEAAAGKPLLLSCATMWLVRCASHPACYLCVCRMYMDGRKAWIVCFDALPCTARNIRAEYIGRLKHICPSSFMPPHPSALFKPPAIPPRVLHSSSITVHSLLSSPIPPFAPGLRPQGP